jgi:long-subunit acyl-CoA synthetase (AMP-forming)
MSLGVKKGGAVGVYATNSPEWMLALKGIDFCGAQCVPLYDTFGPDAVKFIIKHSGLTVLCTSSDNLKALEPVLPEVADQLVQVIVWSSPSGTPAEEAVKAVRPILMLAHASLKNSLRTYAAWLMPTV